MKLEGNKIIVKKIEVYDGSIPIVYTKEIIYTFKTSEAAQRYFHIEEYRQKNK